MGLVGHVLPGLVFIFLGFWHLFNHIKLYVLNPNSYTSLAWFPTPKIRHLELHLIIAAFAAYVSVELFLGHRRLHPFSPDGSIPSNHLKNFEHSPVSLSFLTYAVCALVLDKNPIQTRKPRIQHVDYVDSYNLRQQRAGSSQLIAGVAFAQQRVGMTSQLVADVAFAQQRAGTMLMTQLVAGVAFAQQLLLFRLHSMDHATVEGRYHLLLQVVASVSLAVTVVGIGLPGSFLVGFVRSMSVLFQGVWLVVLACMLWTPALVPKGCFLHSEEDHRVVRCSGDEALLRAKALVNLEFSWVLMSLTVFGVSFYLVLDRVYGGRGGNDMSLVELDEERELVVRGDFGNCNL